MAIGCIDGYPTSFALCTLSSYTFHPDKQAGAGLSSPTECDTWGLSVHGANAIQDSMQGRLFVSAILIGCLPVISYLAGPKFLYTRCEPKSQKWTGELREAK